MAIRHTLSSLLGIALLISGQTVLAELRVVPDLTVLTAPEQPDAGNKQLYIVQLDQPPALSSADSIEQFNPDSSRVLQQVYKQRAQQDRLLLSVNALDGDVYRYNYAFNGMAVMLSEQQAATLRKRKGVARVWRDRYRMVATNSSGEFLGLTNTTNGLQGALGLRGENIIIGVIDSGVAPDHPSLSDAEPGKEMPRLCRSEWAESSLLGLFLCREYKREAEPKVVYDAPSNWRGTCQTGPGFPNDSCNNKLIGARFYRAGADASFNISSREFNSPADADGHGTHLATIAAGNKVEAEILDSSAGTISGMAPRARVAAYKACWITPTGTRAICSTADLVNAIEDAVKDGVDIINYSIGDRDGSVSNPDDLALLAAAEAGILTVVAAGNDGPPEPDDGVGIGTIQSPGTNPWVITVGSTSRPGTFISTGASINSPAAIAGTYETREASFTPKLSGTGQKRGNLVLVDDGFIETPEGETGSIRDGCVTLQNPGEVSGNIALIERGGCNFDLKVRIAQQAGAIAAIVYNNDQNLITMAGTSFGVNIPAVMIGQADGQLIIDKLEEGTAVNITLDANIRIDIVDEGNILSQFSSRGPDIDFIKPDVVAPGKNILGGNTSQPANGKQGELFQYLSGTSQSTPHVAGVAALIKEARPEWSPAAIKSALMTTSRQNIEKQGLDENGLPLDTLEIANTLDIGAGHIVPNSTLNPGLIYDTRITDYDTYLCANAQPRLNSTECETLFAAQGSRPEDINLPSVYVRELIAERVVERTVTNPGQRALYTTPENIDLGSGVSVTVSPSTLDLGTGETGDFTLTFQNSGVAPSDQILLGSLIWTNTANTAQTVYSPLAVLPSTDLLSAPEFLVAEGESGSLPLNVEFGTDGNYQPASTGLHAPLVLPSDTEFGTIADANAEEYDFYVGDIDDPLPESIVRYFLEVDDDLYFRVATFDNKNKGDYDLDLYLYFCSNGADALITKICEDPVPVGDGFSEAVGQSLNPEGSDEVIEVEYPATGTYILDVHGYSTGVEEAEFKAYAWSFSDLNSGFPLEVSGDYINPVSRGETTSLNVSWSGLGTNLWLGGISHKIDASPVKLTVIEIDKDFFQ